MEPTLRAVLLAAGKGVRFGGPLPKQFEDLGGRPVFHWSLEVLAGLPGIAEIVIVTPAGGIPAEFLRSFESASGPVSVRMIEGGARRQDSVAAGLAALPVDASGVALVHDGARPFPPPAACVELAAAAMRAGGALLAVRATDTIKVEEDGLAARTLDRSKLWLAQTPQAIRGDRVAEAVSLMRGATEFTDEAAVLEAMGIRAALVESTPENFKITHAGDLDRARLIAARRA